MLMVREPRTGLHVNYIDWRDWRDGKAGRAEQPLPDKQCAHCWGQGKIHEMSRGRLQWPPVPCDECFGTGRDWRTA